MTAAQGYQVPVSGGGDDVRPAANRASWRWLNGLEQRPPSVAHVRLHERPAPLRGGAARLGARGAAAERPLARPDAFVVFPAPIGPKGLAYMPVLAGLAIPKNAPNPAGGKALIHLLSVSTREDAVRGRVLPRRRCSPVDGSRMVCGRSRTRSRSCRARRRRCRPCRRSGSGPRPATSTRSPRHVHEDGDPRRERPVGAERAGCKARRSWTRRGGVLEARPAEQRALQGEMKAHELRRRDDGRADAHTTVGGSAVLADPPAVAYRSLGWPMVEASTSPSARRGTGRWAHRTMVDDFRFEEALRTT